MRVKTQNINLEGFDRIQEIVMRLKLAERTLPPGDITIKLNQDIIDGYCDYTWYGGLIAEVYSMDSEYRVGFLCKPYACNKRCSHCNTCNKSCYITKIS